MRGGRELEVVQEDKHFSTHYQVSIGRFSQRNPGGGSPFVLQSFKGVQGSECLQKLNYFMHCTFKTVISIIFLYYYQLLCFVSR